MSKQHRPSRFSVVRITIFALVIGLTLAFTALASQGTGFAFIDSVSTFLRLTPSTPAPVIQTEGSDEAPAMQPMSPLSGTISLTTVGATYTQNFDTLANSGTSSTVPTGWDFNESGTSANTLYSAGTGSSATGDTYSFGIAGAHPVTDRAFGGLQSSSVVPTIGTSFTNNTGATITGLAIAYTGEEWRLGATGRADRIDFQYSTDATSLVTGTWTDKDALDFNSPNTTTGGILDGNAAANRTVINGTITGLSIANGSAFWIRWNSFDASGSDDGLAIDDFTLVSGPLSGPYTVGVGGNFSTLTTAVAAYNSLGVSGPVTFSLTDATYSAETFPITIGASTGSSATNTLTIKPATGISPTFSGTNAISLITFNGASNVIIDGSNAGTTSRDLTISNTNTTGSVVRLDTNVSNVVVKNSVLKGASGGFVPGAIVLFERSNAGVIANNTIQNNLFAAVTPATGYNAAVYFHGNGASATTSVNNLITGNTVNDCYYLPMDQQGNYTNTIFSNNTITTVSTQTQSYMFGFGIEPAGGNTVTLDGNRIYDLHTSGATPGFTGIAGFMGAGDTLIVKNNFVSLDASFTHTTANNDFYGIYRNSGTNLSVYNNTVRIGGTGTTSNSFSAAFINQGGNADVRNNIFYNARSRASGTGKHYGIFISGGSVTSDYNDILATGTGGVFGTANGGTTDRTSLTGPTGWQTATGQDAHSISSDPLFTSSTDLHILTTGTTSPVNNAGTPIVGITTDYDGETRNVTTPDIGADEFTPPPTITGAATASAFTTTYGTASAAQTFAVSGANLTANLVATAPTGFEVSPDGTTYGSTATFTQSGGSASGNLRIRLAATAPVGGSYNSQNIVLSSTGATSVNITTAASGNTVSKATPTITFGTPPTPTYLGGNFTVSSSNNNTDNPTTTYSRVSGPCVLSSGAIFTTSGAGTCLVQADTPATTNFNAATAQQSVTIAKANQTISFSSTAPTAPNNAQVGGAQYFAAATSTSGLAVTIASTTTGVCTGSGTNGSATIDFHGVGTCTLHATRTGDTNFNAATAVDQSFSVDNPPAIGVTPLPSWDFGSVVTGHSSTPKQFTLTNTAGSTLTIQQILINGGSAAMFSHNGTTPQNLTNGQQYQFNVTFSPTAAGSKSSTITFQTNIGNFNISLSGTGVAPTITADPSSISFSNVPLSSSVTKTTALTGTNLDGNILCSSPGAEFELSSNGTSFNEDANLPAGGGTLYVKFTATTTAPVTTSIPCSSDPAGLSIPVTATVIQSSIAPNPTQLPFGPVTVGQSSTLTTSLTGTSLSTQITCTPSDTSHFVVSSNGTSFGEDATFSPAGGTLHVRFTPDAVNTYSANVVCSNEEANVSIPLTGTGVAPVCTPPPAEMISWYRGEGDSTDRMTAHDGNPFGGITYPAGMVGQAIGFNGSNTLVDLGTWFDLQTFTIDLWVNPDPSQSVNADIIDNNHTESRSWVVQNTGSGANTQWVFGGAFSPTEGVFFNLTPGVWQHLTITRDTSRVNKVYVNGILAGTGTATAGPIAYDGTQFLRLGVWGGDGSRHFNGQEDEVEIFGRALSQPEIQNIVTADTAGKCIVPSLSISDASVVEGNIGDTNITFTVSVLHPNASDVTVQYDTSDGTATAGSDYTAAVGQTLTIPANTASATFNIPVHGDTTVEPDETFTVTLSNPVNGAINHATATGTILSDDCSAPPTGMVSWWSAEGNANDIFGPNNGTVLGGVTFTGGKVGQAFNFDNGTTTKVTIPDSPSLAISSSISIDAWVKANAYPADQSMILFRGDSRPNLDPYYLSITSAGNARFHIENAGGTIVNVEAPIAINQFVHVAGTLDNSTGLMTLYLNGVQAAQTTTAVRPFAVLTGSNAGLAIGNLEFGSSSSNAFNGLIDEVHLFNRALTDTEVLSIYNGGGGGECQLYHTLSITSANGTVTKAPDRGTQYLDGSSVQLTATPDAGYNFVNWTGDITTTSDNPTTVTMDGDKTITANYASNPTHFVFGASSGTDQWTTATRWTPSYPGTTIGTVITADVNANQSINTAVTVDGTLNFNTSEVQLVPGGSLTLDNGAVLTNTDTLGDTGFANPNCFAVIAHSGSTITNKGAFSVGNLTLESGATLTNNAPNGVITFGGGCTPFMSGNLTNNDGVIDVGTISNSLTGNFNNGAGTYRIKYISFFGPTNVGKLNVSGTATLGGTFAFGTDLPFGAPAVGDVYVVLNAPGGVSGTFTNSSVTLPNGNLAVVSYTATQVKITITAAPSQTFVVTKTADTNDGTCDADCSLREALAAANANSNADTITFAIPVGTDPGCNGGAGPCTITLGGTELDITSSMTIVNNDPSRPIIVSGNNASRVFGIHPATTVPVAMTGFTVTGGSTPADLGGGISNHQSALTLTNMTIGCVGPCSGNSADYGGGIENSGPAGALNLINSTVAGNNATIDATHGGGGIYNHTGGALNITNSAITANGVTGLGGGIYSESGGVTVTNSTISGNVSVGDTGAGAAIFILSGSMTLTNDTISDNSANSGSNGIAQSSSATVNIRNTIVARNTGGPANSDVSGTFNSLGNNLIGVGDGSSGFGVAGDQVGTGLFPIDPDLSLLGNYGGPTQTMAILLGSPAIDAGDDCVLTGCGGNSPTITTDQRGVARSQGSHVDIGAFELGQFTVNTTADHNDGHCDPTGLGDCTLREAILAANVSGSASGIGFAIPTGSDTGCDANGVCTISPTSDLPTITTSVLLDGYTQEACAPGNFAPTCAHPNTLDLNVGDDAVLKIRLDGTNVSSNPVGLTISSGGDSSTIRGLSITNFNLAGISIDNSSNNVISGNFIGLIASGATAGNGVSGILIAGSGTSSGNTIGGDAPAARNVISGNHADGIDLRGGSDSTIVEGNYIGTDIGGTLPLFGNAVGVMVLNSNGSNTIGCEVLNGDNVISGNTESGIHIEGSDENAVTGNLIGTDRTGTAALANGKGIVIIDSSDNNIGVDLSGSFVSGNLISGNSGDGLLIQSLGQSADSNTVVGNFIGTDITGLFALGNGGAGVDIDAASASSIGRSSGDGNVISGNTGEGVEINNGGANNYIQSNFIGVGSDGTTPIGNHGSGVEIYAAQTPVAGSSNNTIGVFDQATNRRTERPRAAKPVSTRKATAKRPLVKHSGPAMLRALRPSDQTVTGANIIAGNVEDGVRVTNDGDVGNTIGQNSIFANTGLGINLGTDGVTANDSPLGHAGPNLYQDFPVIQTAVADSQTITGTLNVTNGTGPFIIEFFKNPDGCDASGHGEGKTYIGNFSTTDGLINASSGGGNLTGSFVGGDVITATATDSAGNTSEFSACFTPSSSATHTIHAAENPIGGTISPIGDTIVNDGADQQFIISPVTGYHIASLLIDTFPDFSVTASGGTYTFTNVKTDHTIEVSFAINTYTLTYLTDGNGTMSGITPQTVNYGENGSPVTAVPNPGYHFLNWSDNSTSNPRTDLNITADATYTANFAANQPGDIVFTFPTYQVNESGGNAEITVIRSGGTDGQVTATLSTSDGTAHQPGDYGAVVSQLITFNDGVGGPLNPQTILVPIVNDSVYEGDETVNLTLSATSGAHRPAAQPPSHSAVLTIIDDDPAPTTTTITNTAQLSTPSAVGIPYTVAWHVETAPPAPAGTPTISANSVNVTVDGGAGCTGDVDASGNGSCQITPAATGNFLLKVHYTGDANYAASDSGLFNHTIVDTPVQGTYAPISVALGGNTNVVPNAAPTHTTNLTLSTSAGFHGVLDAFPGSGEVRITDAYPAGVYTMTVTAFNGPSVSSTTSFQLTVTTTPGCAGLAFAPANDFAMGTGPTAVAIMDIDGDRNQDIVTGNSAGTVLIRSGDGHGGFGAPSTMATFDAPIIAIAVADFNGDGQEDIAALKSGTPGTVEIMQNGGGSFPLIGSYTVGDSPSAIAVGDFNGDGIPDVVTANFFATNLSVLLGNGNGGLTSAPDVTAIGFGSPRGVAIGDFNGDGKQDLAVAENGTGKVGIFLGAGDGTFGPETAYATDAGAYTVAVGYFNADNFQDLAVVNANSNTVSVLLGGSGGTFGPATNYTVGTGPFSVAVADFTNDGISDLVIAYNGDSHVSVLTGTGTGSFGPPVDFGTDPGARRFAIGDFNGDNRLDLATADQDANNVSILLRQCNTAPTIGAVGVSRQDGSPSSNSTIANVNDAESGPGGVTVTVDGGASSTANGVTVSNIVNTNGTVTADVVASCLAADADFTLTATDGNGATATATLHVTVSANSAPVLTYSTPQTVIFGGSLNLTPTAATDNGSATYSVQPGDGLTTPPTVDPATGVVSITNAQPAGSHTITIRATDNCNVTTDATFTLNVGAAPTISISDVTKAEGDSGTTTFTFTLTKTGATALNATGNFQTHDGLVNGAHGGICGQPGVDYIGLGGNFGFLPAETTKTFDVAVCGDTAFELDEIFTMDLTNAGNATFSKAQGVGTITNDDAKPTLSINNATFVGDTFAPSGFAVALSGTTEVYPVTVHYQTSDGSATQPSDYTATSGTVTFTSSANSLIGIPVQINGDNVQEPVETFSMDLDSPTNATISNGHGIGTIQNDDHSSASIGNVSQFEQNGGTSTFAFPVTLSAPVSTAVTINYSTADGSATAGSDYVGVAGGSIVIPALSTTGTINITVNGDATLEPDETFTVTITSSDVTIGTGTGTGTVLNDECTAPPTNMVSWYPAEGNANDIAGTNNGTRPNGPAFGSGKVGQAFTFDGSQNPVEVSDNASLDLQAMTIDAWVFPTSVDGAEDIIVNKESNAGAVQYEMGIKGTRQPVASAVPVGNLTIFIGGVSGFPNEDVGWADGGGRIPLNTWTHVAMTFDGTTANAYINGVQTRHITGLSGTVPTSTGPFRIGARTSGVAYPTDPFNGSIDEVEVFNRALAQPEIAAISDASGGGKCHVPVVQFGKPAYIEDESQTAAITISRSGDTTGISTISFATVAGGSATPGVCGSGGDYVAVSNQLITFNPHDTVQTANVQICGDLLNEPPETVKMALTGQTGSVLGSQDMAVLTINDTATQFENPAPITMTSGSTATPYPATLTVSGAPTVNGGMRVTLYDLATDTPENLRILLVSPFGQKFVMMGDSGGSNTTAPGVTLTFDDNAAQGLPDSTQITTGKYKPTTWVAGLPSFPAPAPAGGYPQGGPAGTATFQSAFGLTNPNGVWKLYVIDDGGTPLGPVNPAQIAGGWGIQFQIPSAAGVSVSGRVTTPDGRGLRNATVSITDSQGVSRTVMTGAFGAYQFDDVASGGTYVVSVSSKRYRFVARTLQVTDTLADVDFVGDE